jgi:hypothetical protein
MKRKCTRVVVLSCICFFLGAFSIAKAEDPEAAVNQLSSELKKSGVVTGQEADAIKSPLKDMMKKGATKADLKSIVTEFSKKGLKGEDLKNSVNSTKDLVIGGESAKEAGNIVSQAASQARAQGLKGKDLSAKVHEAVRTRKAQKDELKKKAGKVRNETQEKVRKIEKGTQQKVKIRKNY